MHGVVDIEDITLAVGNYNFVLYRNDLKIMRRKVLGSMKKLIICFLCFILLIYGGTVKAAGLTSITVDIKGDLEKGKTIEIFINVDNIDSIYAAEATLKYDPKVLNVISFEKGDLINKSGTNTFDVGNQIDNIKGIAKFGGFSCLGQTNGFSGSGTFLKINAKLLKKANFHINSQPFLVSANDVDNLKIEFCDKNIKEVNYEFKGYEFKVGGEGIVEEIKPGNAVVIPDTNSRIKPSTNIVPPGDMSRINSDVKESTSKDKESTNNVMGLITKTKKNFSGQKVALIGGAIVLVFVVIGLGGVYFYRKKQRN